MEISATLAVDSGAIPAPTPLPLPAPGNSLGLAGGPLEEGAVINGPPSPYSAHSYESVGHQLRYAFDAHMTNDRFDAAERIIEEMRRQTGDILWCSNAERRLYHRRKRA